MRAKAWLVSAVFVFVLILAGCAIWEELVPPDTAPAVQATVGELEIAIRLTWSPVERAETYSVFRAEDEGGPYTYIGETPYTTYRDEVSMENTGRWYWYKVRACNASGCGPESAPVQGYAGKPPEPPANVEASDGTYADKILVTWDPVPGATQYEILRDRTPGGGFNPIATVSTLQYEDTNVQPGLIYQYKVIAHNDYGFTLPSKGDPGCVYPCPVP